MSRLRLPLKDLLEDPGDEAALRRISERVESRLSAADPRRATPWLLGATLSAALVLAAFVFLHPWSSSGPLSLADGREFTAVEAKTMSEARLADGSSIELWPGAYIEPLESTATTFSAVVKRGRVDFEVRPGGPRRWTIECGLASVEVVGTAFSCERAPGRLHLEVRRGVVLARGDRVPDRVKRLSAGEVLDLNDGDASAPVVATSDTALPPPAAPASASAQPASESEARTNRAQPVSAHAWRELARSGHNAEAYAALGAEGIRGASKQLGVDDLLALADVARLSGHPAEAVLPLQRILSEFSADSRAPLAAFTLGRLELDSLGNARAAANALQKALALGIPAGLREDVRARLVEAYVKSGDYAHARHAADAYLAEFPNGRHAEAVRRSRP